MPVETRRRADLDIGIELGATAARHQSFVPMTGQRRRRLRDSFLDEGVPRAAIGATTEPFRRLRAALLAHENVLGLHLDDYGTQTGDGLDRLDRLVRLDGLDRLVRLAGWSG